MPKHNLCFNSSICLVEDNPLHETIMRDMLEGSGYRVVSYSSLADFLRDCEPSTVSAIVLDYKLGSELGFEAVSHLRKLGVAIPFVVVTGFGTVSMAVQSMQLGAITVLEKPLNSTSFLNAVDAAVCIAAERQKHKSKKTLILDRIGRLTSRETEVLKLVMEGKSSKEVAKLIGCSAKTVDVHRCRIVTKLEVGSINEVLHELILADLEIELPKRLSS